ncbi:galactokinase [Fulvivirga sp.]|uniref:galactokinase n=1 Tax=Fulvivirga sp. TaxID=1931237 RepID=UPI0032EC71ED
MQNLVDKVVEVFNTQFGKEALVVSAPGRINIIGEHTDYNMGFVFPAAISESIYFAMGPSNSLTECTCISIDENESFTFDLNDIEAIPSPTWKNYVLGVVAELQNAGKTVQGFNLAFSGNIPVGSGMSSSAALECGLCFGLNELYNLGLSRKEVALISQAAEHNYAGVKCGIMDQFSSLMGKEDQAFILDCRNLELTYVRVNLQNYSLVLCNSNVSHSLVTSAYNERRQQCEEGVALVKTKYPNVQSLRDINNMDMLNEFEPVLNDTVYKRCKFIIEENQRVLDMGTAFEKNDLQTIGNLLNKAHYGLRYEFEITCEQTDFLADQFLDNKFTLGARQMGGGFGGCIIAVVETEKLNDVIKEVSSAYAMKYKEATFLPIEISNGCQLVNN